jgi:hypothetical protein
MDSFGQIKAHGSRMYSHAFATLFLCEIFGMTGDLNVKREIHSAINFIIRNQISSGQAFGGWRYEPGQQDADTSITVCQVQALRAARNVGITVHKDVIEGARSYIVSNYHNGGDYAGCFGYQPADLDMEVMFTGRDRTSMALTAAGLVSLQSGGEYDTYRAASGIRVDFNDAVNQIIARRYDQGSAPNARRVCDFAFWYGHYYAAQAIRNYSHRKPEVWKAWNERNRTNFLSMQKKNGAWVDEVGGFDERYNAYATAMACLVLSVSNDYLPIFQN